MSVLGVLKNVSQTVVSQNESRETRRVYKTIEFQGRTLVLREAFTEDVPRIIALFDEIYGGKYPLEFGQDHCILQAEIVDTERFLWLVAEDESAKILIGSMMFQFDPSNRLGKAAGPSCTRVTDKRA